MFFLLQDISFKTRQRMVMFWCIWVVTAIVLTVGAAFFFCLPCSSRLAHVISYRDELKQLQIKLDSSSGEFETV